MYPVASAVAPTAMYPAASLRPSARPRPCGPTRSIFMFTVIDQASPWLTPSSTLAATIHHHDGAQASMNGTGSPATQPATSRVFLVCRAVSGPAARFVSALVTPKAMMKLNTARYPDRWNTRVPIRLVVVRSSPTMPPTHAFTTTSSVNCGQFSRSPSRTGRAAGAVPPAWLAGCGTWAGDVTAGPGRGGSSRCSPASLQRAADGDGQVPVAAAGEQAGGRHGPLAVAAHHRERFAGQVRRLVREGTQFEVLCTGQVPRLVLGRLADVEHAAGHLGGRGQPDPVHRQARGVPGRHAAGQFPGQVLVSDAECLADQVGPVLAKPEDER